ncbi:MAG: DNA polymerase III subunit gamma/tau, partial [Alphaproteobacteria bacterium]|nr:DNA polymerase III subunit gamma/tau [Alphaproteobacteria bacterium]
SILDQAMALGGEAVTAALVRDMLGLADRGESFELFDALMRGDIAAALDRTGQLYRAGADPVVLVQDLMELTHWLTRVKVAPQASADISAGASETEIKRGGEMAGKLSIATLTRAWQLLLKGLAEVQHAPLPLQAFEMVLIRLAYAADLPSPADLVRALQSGGTAPAPTAGSSGGGGARGGPAASAIGTSTVRPGGPSGSGAARAQIAPMPAEDARPQPQNFEQVVALAEARREAGLRTHLVNSLHLVAFEPGRIEFRPAARAPADLANKLGQFLTEATGRRWVVSVSQEPGTPTLADQRQQNEAKRLDQAAEHPLVRAVMTAFPGAAITAVRDLSQPMAAQPAEGGDAALPADGVPAAAPDPGADLVYDADPDMSDGDDWR